MTIIAKPYKLHNSIQHYDWGTIDNKAFIPKLLGIKPILNKPYAELWIGAHPKAPSEIIVDGEKNKLNELIKEFPTEILGEYVSKKFDSKLPFLLKILSASKALSIQTHPNKRQAKELHAKDPAHYPDDNHKPEIAIAIDKLTAIAGFRPIEEIRSVINGFPEFKEFAGEHIYNNILNKENPKSNQSIKVFYESIIRNSEDDTKLEKLIISLRNRIVSKNDPTPEETQFLEQFEEYGVDVGLISLLLFNLVELKPLQAIFTNAGEPHAYIKGNIIECMANSDNVVRAGLTEKFKDVEILLEILNYKFEKNKIINEVQQKDNTIYKTTADEFEVTLSKKEKSFESEYTNLNKPSVYLVLNGSIKIVYNNNRKFEIFKKGESFLIPALLDSYKIIYLEDSEIIQVEVP